MFDLYKQGKTFTHVVTVCDESADENCPVFPGMTTRLHLPFLDPAKVEGTQEEKLHQVRMIRDQIKDAVKELIDWIRSGGKKKLNAFWEMKKIPS